MKLFAPYFKQLYDKVIEEDYDLELLVRSVGIDVRLILYLKGCTTKNDKSISFLSHNFQR